MAKNNTNLHVVRSPQQWRKLDQEIATLVQKLVNGEDENARHLAYLVNLIYCESDRSDQEMIVRKTLESAFVNSVTFEHSLDAWMNEYVPEQSAKQPAKQRKRA